jgi:FAD binding domain/Berberine and berberine like
VAIVGRPRSVRHQLTHALDDAIVAPVTVRTASAISHFAEGFAGDIIGPADDRYDEARRVWNGMFDRRPALIVRPTSADDVAAAIRLGREQDWVIAVRGGGHSMQGLSTCDEGLVIDLSAMRGVTVDPAARTARANGGAHLSELDAAAQAHGLVCPVGVVGHTGVGGLTLGGGFGRLQRRFGLTIDNLLAVELVTADGRRVRASADEDRELFWGIRGAGPNFGVVTAFEFRLHAFGPDVVRGMHVFPAARAHDAWAVFRELTLTAPREVGSISVSIGPATPVEDFPPGVAGQPVMFVGWSHLGTEADAERDLAPLLALDDASRAVRRVNYVELQTSLDEASAWGHRIYSKGGFADDLRPEIIDALLDHATSVVGDSGVSIWGQGGALRDTPEDGTAFTGRHATVWLSAECDWDDPAQDAAAIGWGRTAMAIIEPDAVTGRYANDVADAGTDPGSIYGAEKHQRLVAVKRKWDPDNVFRLNQNIRPD